MAIPTTVTITPEGRVRKLYGCSSCAKTFRRSEHCIRHERAHTQEKPFTCQFCLKKYARKDLVKRHERTIHADLYDALEAVPKQSRSRTVQRSEAVTQTTQFHDSSNGRTNRSPAPSAIDAHHDAGHDSESVRRDSSGIGKDSFQDISNIDPLLLDPSTTVDGTDQQNIFDASSVIATGSGTGPEAIYQFQQAVGTNGNGLHVDVNDVLDDISHEHRDKRPRLDAGSTTALLATPQTTSNYLDTVQTFSDPFELSLFTEIFALDDTYPMPDLSLTPISTDSTLLPDQTNLWGNTLGIATETDQNQQDHLYNYSRRLFRQLPRILQEKSHTTPRAEIDSATYERLCDDIMNRSGMEASQKVVPSNQELQRFLNAYIDCFHRHLPIVHLPSLLISKTPSPLILALSCIGALYRLERRRAVLLYQLALDLLQKYENEYNLNPRSTPIALWAIQSRILLSIFAFFTGDAALVNVELQRLGFYLTDYRLRKAMISREVYQQDQLNWAQYVQRESQKRVLCATNIMSNLAMVTYDVTPGFVNPEDLDYELPDEEHLWNAPSESEWQQLWASHNKQRKRSLRSALMDMISGDHVNGSTDANMAYNLTAFGGLVLMHAVCIHMWTSLQFTRAIGTYSEVGTVGNVSLQESIRATGFSTLMRCQKSLAREGKEGESIEPPWALSEGPLLFNCQAVLRIAFTRLFLPEVSIPRIVMMTGTDEEVREAAAAYVACPLERSDFNTKAAAKACQGFLSPVKIGHLLVRKTAAFAWSVEHAVAGWDSALYLLKWVHTVEVESAVLPTTTEEQAIFSELKQSLDEVDRSYIQNSSLAAAVARAWAPFLTDVWVWGITPKMGAALERLADCYQDAFESVHAIM